MLTISTFQKWSKIGDCTNTEQELVNIDQYDGSDLWWIRLHQNCQQQPDDAPSARPFSSLLGLFTAAVACCCPLYRFRRKSCWPLRCEPRTLECRIRRRERKPSDCKSRQCPVTGSMETSINCVTSNDRHIAQGFQLWQTTVMMSAVPHDMVSSTFRSHWVAHAVG